MSFTFEKILFAGIMIGILAFGSNLGSAHEEAALPASITYPRIVAEPPAFILGAPAVLVETPTATATTTAPSPEEAIAAELLPFDAAEARPAPKAAPEVAPRATVREGSLVPTSTFQSAIFRPEGVVAEPVIAASAALIADLATGERYYGLRADKRWPIASITKLMTAAAAEMSFPPTSTITLTEADFSPLDTTIDKKLSVGQTYSVADLERAMLTVSSNEAAEAVARASGDRNAFVDRLNGLAAAWNLGDTHFGDPTGLSSVNQSTAYDLRRLAAKLYDDYPNIFATTKKKQNTILDLSATKRLTLSNINAFAGDPLFLGGKTGYTEDAGGNLLSVFVYQKRPIAVIILGADDRFGETQKLFAWFRANFSLNTR